MPDMRFAPAPVLLSQTGSGGLNQTNVRSHNERLLLDLLRRGKTLSRFEIGQRSNLSAQTVSVLVRALRAEGLLLEGERSRGRIGPPTTPFSLNPDGAYAIGVYVGVKVIDVCCLDFCGRLKASQRVQIDMAGDVLEQAEAVCRAMLDDLGSELLDRCLGIGLALNRKHWPDDLDAERAKKIEDLFTNASRLPCYLLEDTISAATGEVLFGEQADADQFAFVHIGMKTTIRVVLNGQAQKHFDDGLLPLPGLDELSQRLDTMGAGGAGFWLDSDIPELAAKTFENWSSDVSTALEHALVVILAVLDLPQIVVVAPLNQAHLLRLQSDFAARLSKRGVATPVRTGHNAQFAKASGAASCVLSTRFAPNWVV